MKTCQLVTSIRTHLIGAVCYKCLFSFSFLILVETCRCSCAAGWWRFHSRARQTQRRFGGDGEALCASISCLFAAQVKRPPFHDAANAVRSFLSSFHFKLNSRHKQVGAAMAQVSCVLDTVDSASSSSPSAREQLLTRVKREAIAGAVKLGALESSVAVVELEEIALACELLRYGLRCCLPQCD